VGDSPIPGAGLYALDGCAATATGHGESILKVTLSRLAVDALREGLLPGAAAARAIAELRARTSGEAGIIAVDAQGRVGHHKNSAYMPWAAVEDGTPSGGE
jgi:beta-aspartyl-peptidase (threonine type)